VEHILKQPESDWRKIIAVSRKLPSRFVFSTVHLRLPGSRRSELDLHSDWLRYDLGLSESQADDVGKGKGRLVWITADLIEETVAALKTKFVEGGVAEGTQYVFKVDFDWTASTLTWCLV
jgi:hypothetical protein